MEDEESGGSDFNSSDGGSGSWSPSPSRGNQHVPSREGLHFLPLKSWSSGKVLSYLCNGSNCVSINQFTKNSNSATIFLLE